MHRDLFDMKTQLDRAVELHQSGRLTEAQAIYRKIVDINPEHPDALHLLGFSFYQQGEIEEAERLVRKAIDCSPKEPLYYNNLGLILKDKGKIEESITCYRMALASAPTMVQALNNLGIALQERGDVTEAIHCFKRALTIDPGLCDTYNNLGNALKDQGMREDAFYCINKALELNPAYAEAYSNLGSLFHEQGEIEEAIGCYRKALEISPAKASFHLNLGNALSTSKKTAEAIEHFRKALELQPGCDATCNSLGRAYQEIENYEAAANCYRKATVLNPQEAEGYANLGDALLAQNKPDEALPCYRKVLEMEPRHTRALAKMGLLHNESGNPQEAISCYEKVLHIEPDFAEAHNNLGVLYLENKELKKAQACFERAIDLKPDYADPLFNMGTLYQGDGRYEEGLACFEKALNVDPAYAKARWMRLLSLPVLYSNEEEIALYRRRFTEGLDILIEKSSLNTDESRKEALSAVATATNFYLQYQGGNDLALQKKYGRFICRVMAANFPHWSGKRAMPPLETGQKIRIGYVSSLMRAHTIGTFLMGWIEEMDRNDFEIFSYYIDSKTDDTTEKFREKSDHFYQIHGNLEAMAQQIYSDNLHILVYSDIGMYAPVTQLAAMRLAPIQCKGWGHPVTTGLPTVDYYLSSDLMEPENGQEHYSEKLIRLPNLALAFKKPNMPKNQKSRKQFGIPEEAFVYLSTQSLFKYLPQYDWIFPRIAKSVPKALFVFLSNPSANVTRQLRRRLGEAFEKEGLNSEEYISFQPRLKSDDFLSLNLISDVLLDTIDWSGGKTTLEGISCGLPVVTLPGRFMRGRHAYAMLKMMALEETIASDENSYVEIAARLGQDKGWRLEARSRIEQQRCKLYNDVSCIRSLEDFYRMRVRQSLTLPDAQPSEPVASPGKNITQHPSSTDSEVSLKEAASLHQSGDLDSAEQIYRKILEAEPHHPDALHLLGCIVNQRGKPAEALHLVEKALAACPGSPLFLYNLGLILKDLGRCDEAVSSCRNALKIKPDFAAACSAVAGLCEEQGNLKEALHYYQKLIILQPGDEQTYFRVGHIFKQTGQQEKAINALRIALEICPSFAEAYNDLGNIAAEQGEEEEALSCFEKAIQLKPDLIEAFNNRGNIFRKKGMPKEAIDSYKKALEIRPDFPEVCYNLGNTYQELGETVHAIDCYEKALEVNPSYIDAATQMVHLLQQTCNWPALQKKVEILDELIQKALEGGTINTEAPFVSVSIHSDPKLNFEIARARAKAIEGQISRGETAFSFENRQGDRGRITLGYLSNDFRNHPVAHLILGLFRLHDRNDFEVYCYSSGKKEGEIYRTKIERDCDQFVDIQHMNYEQAARRIYEDKIDILIDLMGHTNGNRLGIFAYRPAPIQVTYLGFPGSTGADFIDYIITDRIVTPVEHSPCYSEKIVYLPHCYQINNNGQEISQRKWKKADFGLPDRSFVFCSFNQSFKIEPVMFDIWMNILRKTPESVLWLMRYNETSSRNLKEEAKKRGINPGRLIFAGVLPKDEHLSRLRLADLALDTRVYNGHTSTSDALWAGVPVITLQGNHFASRVSSSLLSAIDLPELITLSLDDYRSLAISLATNPDRLRRVNDKLKRKRLHTPLFDTESSARSMEQAYRKMLGRYDRGEEDRKIEVLEGDRKK